MLMSIWKRIKRMETRRLVAVIVVILILLAVPLWILLQPGRNTPSFLRERGIEWHIFIEEPISIDEVESIIVVFTNQVEVLFDMETRSIVYEHMKDDGIQEYSSSDSYPKEYSARNEGHIRIPVYFLTGFGTGNELGWASRNPQYFKSMGGLEFRIVIPNDSEDPKYLTRGLPDLIVLLHEFGHIMGLKDLYLGGDVDGCSHLWVIMNNVVMSLNSTRELNPPSLETLLINRTDSMYPIGNGTEPEILQVIEEVYLEHNSLWFAYYDIVTRKGGEIHLTEPRVYEYDLNQLRGLWTEDEAAFIGMERDLELPPCPQEFK
jgi:hypothetical protein